MKYVWCFLFLQTVPIKANLKTKMAFKIEIVATEVK